MVGRDFLHDDVVQVDRYVTVAIGDQPVEVVVRISGLAYRAEYFGVGLVGGCCAQRTDGVVCIGRPIVGTSLAGVKQEVEGTVGRRTVAEPEAVAFTGLVG